MEQHLRFLTYEPIRGRLIVYRPGLGSKIIAIPPQQGVGAGQVIRGDPAGPLRGHHVWVMAHRQYVLSNEQVTFLVQGSAVSRVEPAMVLLAQHPLRPNRFLARVKGFLEEVEIHSDARATILGPTALLPQERVTYRPTAEGWVAGQDNTLRYTIVHGRMYQLQTDALIFQQPDRQSYLTYPPCHVMGTGPSFALGGIQRTGADRYHFQTPTGRKVTLPEGLGRPAALDDAALWTVWDRWLEITLSPVLPPDLIRYLGRAAWPDFGEEKLDR